MSRIYFHSFDGEAEVRGSERALFGSYANTAMVNALGLRDAWNEAEHLALVSRALATKPSYQVTGLRMLETWLTVSGDATLHAGETSISAFSCALNTLLATGGDPMVLAARLHGQCEIHAWVDGPNREWLAEIIERGRAAGIYRSGMGWESVVELLRADSQSPVVTSYSVCEQFPNAGVAMAGETWTPQASGDDQDTDTDAWYGLPEAEQWSLAMEALRKNDNGLELTPGRWQWPSYHFGTPATGYTVMEWAVAAGQPTPDEGSGPGGP